MKKKRIKIEYGDFHLHTIVSGGGTLTAHEAIQKINKYNKKKTPKDRITCISFTDHETTDGIDKAKEFGKMHGIEVVPGIEFKTRERVDILGYMMDHTNWDFKRRLIDLKEKRLRWLLDTLNALNKELANQGVGRNINERDVEASMVHLGPVSIQDVAYTLVVLKIEDDPGTAMRKYFEKGAPAYVEYKLPAANKVIGIIKDADGEAVIAHPVYYKDREDVIKRLVDLGADGIEAYHWDHNSRITWETKELAKKHGLMVYGGSDYHGPHKYLEISRRGKSHLTPSGEFFYGNIRSSFPYAEIGKVKLPKKYTKEIIKLWEKKQKS